MTDLNSAVWSRHGRSGSTTLTDRLEVRRPPDHSDQVLNATLRIGASAIQFTCGAQWTSGHLRMDHSFTRSASGSVWISVSVKLRERVAGKPIVSRIRVRVRIKKSLEVSAVYCHGLGLALQRLLASAAFCVDKAGRMTTAPPIKAVRQ